jgi:hypothetical protein
MYLAHVGVFGESTSFVAVDGFRTWLPRNCQLRRPVNWRPRDPGGSAHPKVEAPHPLAMGISTDSVTEETLLDAEEDKRPESTPICCRPQTPSWRVLAC